MSDEDQEHDGRTEGDQADDLEIIDGIEVIDDEVATPATGASIFDLFEPPPEIDADRFGPIPIVPDAEFDGDDIEIDADGLERELLDGDLAGDDTVDEMTPLLMGNIEPEGETDALQEDALHDDAPSLGLFDTVPDDPDFVDRSGSDAVAASVVDTSPGLTVDELLAPLEGNVDELGDEPLSADQPASGFGDLPHWTEPPTGQVPAVLVGTGDEEWSDLSGPQWQGEGPGEGDDLTAVFGDTAGVVVGGDPIDDTDQDLADIPSPAGAPQRTAAARVAPEVDVDATAFESGRNVPQAIAVGVIFAGLALFAFQLGAAATVALITAIAVLGSAELFGAMRKVGLRPATLLGIVASAALPLAVYNRGESAFVMVTALLVVFGALWYIVGAETHRPALNLGMTMLGVFWIGGLASFGSLLILLDDGISILLAAIIVTVAYDTFAFAGGKAFGSRPFHDASPNKTWEGTIVGVVAAVVAGFVVGILEISPFSGELVNALLLGVVGGLLAPIGDLTESMVKRDLGVKDMGTILPGHGGILDRLDGLLFVLPGVYYLARVLDFV